MSWSWTTWVAAGAVRAMSNYAVRVIGPSGPIGYSMFQGSSDVLHPAIFATEAEMRAAWRTPATWRACVCDPCTPLNVTLSSDFGDGPGVICSSCLTILRDCDAEDDDE